MNYGQKQLLNGIADNNNFFFELKPVEAWRAILGWAVAVTASLLVGGVIAIATFPLASIALGWLLYRRYPLFYSSFVWWLWFYSPMIRRIIDFRCGYFTVGPWTLTPIVVTAMSILTLCKYLPKAHKLRGIPFVLAAASCVYGFLIHLTREGLTDFDNIFVAVTLGWLGPIAFGFHLLTYWRDYPSYRQNIQRTFLWGVLSMGCYGIVQYVFAPPWDAFYLKTEQAAGQALSYGVPEPFGIRVFSSMDAPQVFATTIGTGLILLFCIRGSHKLWATGFGYLSFLLSLARSGWLSWSFSALIFFSTLKFNLKIRMLIGVVMTVLIIYPITTVEPFSSAIGERIESLADTEGDGSLRSRQGAFNLLIGYALVEFVGYGLKSPVTPDVVVNKGYILGDNGIIVLLFALGWIGAGPYILSLALSIFQIQQACQKNKDLILYASYAIVLGQLSQIYFKNIFHGGMAMILWGFIGIGMSGCNYYTSQKNSQNTA